jgi:hypothetical protein
MSVNYARQARELYKRLMFVGRDYPGGLDLVRQKAKPQFFALKDERDEKVTRLMQQRQSQ